MEIGERGSGRSLRLLTLNPQKTVGVGGKMRPETGPLAHRGAGGVFPLSLVGALF